MSFSGYEESVDAGSPIELYAFEYGTHKLLYTSNEIEVIFNTEIYVPLSISRTKISVSTERGKGDITVTVPRSAPVALLFRAAPPTEALMLTLFRMHRDDIGNESVAWKGRVVNCRWLDDQTADLNCESFFTSMARNGLRRGFGKACDHALFDDQCRLIKTDYEYSSTADAFTNLTITVAGADGQADGYYEGGIAQWINADTGITERRMITKHVGEVVTVTHHIIDLSLAQTVKLYPGCPHNMSVCKSRFDNLPNYGGFPFMPEVNPFGGSTLF